MPVLLALLLAGVGGAHAWLDGSGNPAVNEAAQGNETFAMIVVFKDLGSVARLRAMCSLTRVGFNKRARLFGLTPECHMPFLCRRVYSSALFGFAGNFTSEQAARLSECLPGAVHYKEPDRQVFKAEHSEYWKAQHLGGNGPSGGGRRLQGDNGADKIQASAVDDKVHSTGEPGVVNMADISAGQDLAAPGEKQQHLIGKLWNLDRMDQRDLPLDSLYKYGTGSSAGTGVGTTVYVVDSGIMLEHQEFKDATGTRNRASYGFDFIDDKPEAADCDGHGTHVAATAVGLQVGVAKDADVVAVRILDCTGSGSISDTVAALDWVAANAKKPAVVTLSLGIQIGSWSRVLEEAVRSLVQKHGITVTVAAGNSQVDACYVAPANVPEAITVSASNLRAKPGNTGDPEDLYRWSNTGPCIDIFAPGVEIYSACGGATRCSVLDGKTYTYASGTSMAVPQVAGVAAIYLSSNPQASPAEVLAKIVSSSTQGKLSPELFKPGTPNRALYSRLDEAPTVQAADGPKP